MDYGTARWSESQMMPQPHRQAEPLLYRPAAGPAPAPAPDHQAYPSYPYVANPNPNPHHYPSPNPSGYFPRQGDPIAISDPLRPYAVEPYIPHGGYEALHATHYSYQLPHAEAGVSSGAAYYHTAGGGQGQPVMQSYVVEPLGFGAVKRNIWAQTTNADLEKKKLKLIESGTEADSVRMCLICNVACNSEKVFASHLAGTQHVMKALGRPLNGAHPTFVKPTRQVTMASSGPKRALRKGFKAAKVAQSMYCEVCKAECNTQEMLNNHRMGKKHKKKVQELQEAIRPKPTTATLPTNSVVKDNPVANKEKDVVQQTKGKAAPTEEDLEAKKKKVMEAGAASDAVRVCSLCNIVVNSQKVFDFHLTGQKHASMVKKKQEEQVVLID